MAPTPPPHDPPRGRPEPGASRLDPHRPLGGAPVSGTGTPVSPVGRDVEAIHLLGLGLAEARTESELLEIAADTLHARHGVDAAGLVTRSGRSLEGRLLLFRPWSDAALDAFTRRAEERAEGGDRPLSPRWTVDRRRFGPELPTRGNLTAGETRVLPLGSRARSTATFALAFTADPDPHAIRFAAAVANLLALHLDRMTATALEEDLRFRAILDAMPQAVWLVDPTLRVARRNRAGDALARELGWEDDREVGSLGDLDLAAAARVVLDGRPAASSLEARLPGDRVASVTVAPVPGSDGRPEAAVLVVEDVTRARRMQAQLAQADRLAGLGQMLSGVAHELNNPLATVVGFAQIARSLPPGPALEKRLGLVHEEALRCQRIVGNLLRFARRHDPERKPVALNEIVEATLGLFQYQLRVDGIRADRTLDRTIPAVLADAHEIQQVLVNLLGNAHQAIRGAGREGRIEVRTYAAGDGGVVLEVCDDGPGIPEAIRDRLFDPFFTTKEPGQGTGLGLSLVFGTVRAHGGSIEVESREGDGATFRISLPTTPPAPGTPGTTRLESPAGPRRSARVLVVDDEPAVALLICETLGQDGHRPVAVHHAEEVLRRLREEAWDLVVCDLKMPGLGAEHLYGVVASEFPNLARRFVLTTGDTVTLEPEALAKRAGAPLLHKPFPLEALREAVRDRLRDDGSA